MTAYLARAALGVVLLGGLFAAAQPAGDPPPDREITWQTPTQVEDATHAIDMAIAADAARGQR